jgi:hypothetical protein
MTSKKSEIFPSWPSGFPTYIQGSCTQVSSGKYTPPRKYGIGSGCQPVSDPIHYPARLWLGTFLNRCTRLARTCIYVWRSVRENDLSSLAIMAAYGRPAVGGRGQHVLPVYDPAFKRLPAAGLVTGQILPSLVNNKHRPCRACIPHSPC